MIAAVLVLLLSSPAFASNARVAEIATQFNKTKHVNKQKRGAVKQRFVEVRSQPLVRANPASYSGSYRVEGLDFSLELDVTRDGIATGKGIDGGRTFVLQSGRIDGALLTATKLYRDGSAASFEGAFLTQRVREGIAPDAIAFDQTQTGLGVTGLDLHLNGVNLTKLFYRSER
jgi:hypothetical protein